MIPSRDLLCSPEFNLQKGLFCARLAQLAYDRAEIAHQVLRAWEFDRVVFFDRGGTQAFVALAVASQIAVVSFRGTEITALEDVLADLRIPQVPGPMGGEVHKGFLQALSKVWFNTDNGVTESLPEYLDELRREIPGLKLLLVGHSLGGALAVLAAAHLHESYIGVDCEVISFGCPRVGDSAFAAKVDRTIVHHRAVYQNDAVARIPTPPWYRHSGDLQFIDHRGRLLPKASFLTRLRCQFYGRLWGLLLFTLGVLCLQYLTPKKLLAGLLNLFDGLHDHQMKCYADALERLTP